MKAGVILQARVQEQARHRVCTMSNPQMRVPAYYLRFMQLRLQLEEVIACRIHVLEPPASDLCSFEVGFANSANCP